MIQSLLARGDEKDHSRTHGVRPGDDPKETGNHPLQAFRITTTTGDLPAALWYPPERPPEILTVVFKGEVDSGVEIQLPAQTATLGRLGPDSNPRRTCHHHPVEGVGLVGVDLRPGRPPLLTTVAGERVSQYPVGGALAQISPPPLPPLVGS
jgi:hypothetical protein